MAKRSRRRGGSNEAAQPTETTPPNPTGPEVHDAAASAPEPVHVAPQRYAEPTAPTPEQPAFTEPHETAPKRYRTGDRSPSDLFLVDGQVTDRLRPGQYGTRLARPGTSIPRAAVAYLNGND